jgi:hypothetical protein
MLLLQRPSASQPMGQVAARIAGRMTPVADQVMAQGPGLIQSPSQVLLPRLRAWVEVGGMASSLCPKAPLLQPISI